MSPSGSSRWCPTPEQLMILEEMYRSGVRTPNSSQIQRITAHLSLYGKIEGKNVFYWFQNHKARDRQKLRRKLIKQVQQQQQQQQLYYHHHHHHDNQLQQNQSNYSHHHILNYFDPSAAMAFHQLSYHNSSTLPFLMGGHDIAPAQMMNYQWKAENPLGDYYQMGKSITRMYDHDWMMMVDVGPPSPCCTKPIKTLELFPIKATNLKDECNPSSKHL